MKYTANLRFFSSNQIVTRTSKKLSRDVVGTRVRNWSRTNLAKILGWCHILSREQAPITAQHFVLKFISNMVALQRSDKSSLPPFFY